MRVLICDDVADLRLLLRLWLERDPELEVVGEAATGAEVVELAGRTAPDVVLLDFNMPVMSGAEALPRLLMLRPEPRVIVFVGARTAEVEQRALALGAECCLDKSAGMEIVRAAIRSPASAPAPLV